jgi:hypothetical protein
MRDNPAIYLNKSSKPDQIASKYTSPLNQYGRQHVNEKIRSGHIFVDTEKGGKCVLVKEMTATAAEQKLMLVAFLWHELGHGFNERKPQPNNEQTAYQFEIEMLGADDPWTYLQGLGVTKQDPDLSDEPLFAVCHWTPRRLRRPWRRYRISPRRSARRNSSARNCRRRLDSRSSRSRSGAIFSGIRSLR